LNIKPRSRAWFFRIVAGASLLAGATGLDPACRQTPGSAPQPPLYLLGYDVSSTAPQLRIATSGSADDLSMRVLRVFLVPDRGPATLIRIDPDHPAHVVTVPLPKLARGDYRVLVEDNDLSAPAGCPLSFFVVIGTIQVP
jgi:hypothetical protein